MLMRRRPPRSTRTAQLCPYTTLFRASYLRVLLIKAARLGGDAVTEVNSSRSVLLSRRFKSLLEKHFATIHDVARYACLLNVTERALSDATRRSEEHTSELQSLMRISYAVFCLKKNINTTI